MNTVMVVGASGVLGQLVCTELLRIFDNEIKLIVTDYKMDRGKRLANSFKRDVEFNYLDIKHKTRTITNESITSYIARVFL